ncbi:hypothetical protein LLEC1_03661 [Akanthomyces lecanii]|uniref:Myb-like domain-containing protein n=1 Tax=Cordyceps confragosa TaxID=2714763 RepID=A0A179IC88_CORDF|nr:hypothetical protein LLEC1_03661 [Akanthomyces lecanii]
MQCVRTGPFIDSQPAAAQGHQGRPSRPQPCREAAHRVCRQIRTVRYSVHGPTCSRSAPLHNPGLGSAAQRPDRQNHLLLLSRTTNFSLPASAVPNSRYPRRPHHTTPTTPKTYRRTQDTSANYSVPRSKKELVVSLLLASFALRYARRDHAAFDPPRLARRPRPALPPAMNNKNWNDRADRDLFFTILSVKNIGVISGAEWTMIGNYMRGMGYGFTNEGCRQHFQGLRRATNKIEAAPPPADMALRRVDPSLNPITRRPGPGRGRPRKSQSAAGEGSAGPESADGGSVTPLDPNMSVSPGVAPGPAPAAAAHNQAMHAEQGSLDQQIAMEDEQALAASADNAPFPDVSASHVSDNTDEHPSKRAKLDSDAMDHEAAMDDEAVLALAAHNGTTAADYGE